MLVRPARLEGRSWSTELAFRITQSMLTGSENLSAAKLRKKLDKSAPKHPAQRKVTSTVRTINGVDCTMVSPKREISELGADKAPIIVYFHGGGYTIGSTKSYAGTLAMIANTVECLLVAPDYRLAPEHPYPAGHEDCLAVAKAVLKTYPEHKVILAGDSAGGALALYVASELSAVGQLESVDALLLVSPWVDPSASGGSMESNVDTDFINPQFLNNCISALMPNEDRASTHPSICFIASDLDGLPRTLVQYGGAEIFADQIEAFCVRLEQSDVELTKELYPSQYHVFQMGSAIDPEAKQAMYSLADFVKA